MSYIRSSVCQAGPQLAKRFEAYALKNKLADADAFKVSVPDVPIHRKFADSLQKIEYEELPTYVTPRDWTSLFTRVSKYEMYCTETPDYTKVTNVTYAQHSTPRYKARLDVDVKSIKITRAEREVLKKLVGHRYNPEKQRISFVCRDLPSMMVRSCFDYIRRFVTCHLKKIY